MKKNKYFIAFISLSIFLITLSIVFPFLIYKQTNDWTLSGQFGDTFGALNAIFSGLALAGVIVTIFIQNQDLEIQREDLKLQREEMKNTRMEFQYNRITTLVYAQLDKFEKELNKFKIVSGSEVFVGFDAIVFLDENLYSNEDIKETKDEQKKIYNIINNLQILSPNKVQIEKLGYKLNDSVIVLKQLLYNSELDFEYLNIIKGLFFNNIGYKTIKVLSTISFIEKYKISYSEKINFSKYNIEQYDFISSSIFLSTIVSLYKIKISDENYVDLKNEWMRYQNREIKSI